MSDSPSGNLPQAVTMESFESVVDANEIVILDFWAAWCGPCKMFAPIFEQVATLHPDIFFGKVDTEAAPDLAQAFQVRSIPTIMAFKKGELVFEQAGVLPAPMFADLLQKLRELVVTPTMIADADSESGADADTDQSQA